MLQGSIVISKDLLGILTEVGVRWSYIKDQEGVIRKVKTASITEVINPYAQSALLYYKLKERMGK